MIVLLSIITTLVVWFVSGILFAPRAAALNYKHGMWSNCEDHYYLRMESAHAGYWTSIWLGPAVMVYWFMKLKVIEPCQKTGMTSIEKAMVKHDAGYRQKHSEEQERRIRQLEIYNAELTKKVLDS